MATSQVGGGRGRSASGAAPASTLVRRTRAGKGSRGERLFSGPPTAGLLVVRSAGADITRKRGDFARERVHRKLVRIHFTGWRPRGVSRVLNVTNRCERRNLL